MKTIRLGTPYCGAVRVFRKVLLYPTDPVAMDEIDVERLEIFQQANGLTPDGICGPLTWVRILAMYGGCWWDAWGNDLPHAARYWSRIQQLLWLDGFIQDAKWPIADRGVRKLPKSQQNILPLADTVVAGRRYAAGTCGHWGAFVSATVMGAGQGYIAATGANFKVVKGKTCGDSGNVIAHLQGEGKVKDSSGRTYPAFGLRGKCTVDTWRRKMTDCIDYPGLWLLEFPRHVGLVVVPDPNYPISDRDGNPIDEPLYWASGEAKPGGLHTMRPVAKCNVNADSRRVLSAAWWDPSKVNVDAPALRLEG